MYTCDLELQYHWREGSAWSACAQLCDGEQYALPECVNTHTHEVTHDESKCDNTRQERILKRRCNADCRLECVLFT